MRTVFSLRDALVYYQALVETRTVLTVEIAALSAAKQAAVAKKIADAKSELVRRFKQEFENE